MAQGGGARRGSRLVAAVLGAAAIAFPAGLVLPILVIDRPLADAEYGILTGIWALLTGGLPLLAIVIFCFSVIFPVAKLAVLAAALRAPQRFEAAQLDLLGMLGKWSMLDVYVVVILMGAIQLGVIADVEPRPGLWVFGGSILLAMTASALMHRARGVRARAGDAERARLARPSGRWVSVAATAAFVAGSALPLMAVEKWIFWSNDYSLLRSLGAMLAAGEHGLFALVVVFVLGLPLARLGGLGLLRWRRAPSDRLLRWVLTLDDWAMADVFALALLVVITKASQMASITPRIGLWMLLASAVLSVYDAWLLRRSLSRAPAT